MSKQCPKPTKSAISLILFHLQTSYLVPRYNPIRRIQWCKCLWPWPNGLNTKQLATFLMLFHPHNSSYLLSQLFVTHLGVALLLDIWPWPVKVKSQGQISPKMGKKPKNCSYLVGYFTSYLLSQLFLTHLGFALLFYLSYHYIFFMKGKLAKFWYSA